MIEQGISPEAAVDHRRPAGLVAYVVDVEAKADGDLAWPQRMVDEGDNSARLGRNWAYFLHINLAASLQVIVDGVQA